MKLTVKQEAMITYSGLGAGLLLCLLAIFGMILSGCTKENVSGSGRVIREERTVARFEELTVEGPFEVHIRQGPEAPLTVEAEDNVMHVVETSVSGTTLYLNIRKHVNLRHFKVIHVYVQSPQFRRIIFSGSGSITGKDTIRTTQFSYECNGSADAQFKVDANEVKMNMNGSGSVLVEGFSREYIANINGSGNVSGEGLKTGNARITINGSGDQSIWVTDRLEVRIAGSGNVRFRGSPATLNTTVGGSGQIIKL